jgi:hypothetical protein
VRVNNNIIQQAALAAAFSAVFNADWFKGQLERLKREADTGGMRPFVPYVIGAAAAYLFLRKGR